MAKKEIDLTLIRDAVLIAADHLTQLRQYSESMRVTGQGCSLSSPFSDGVADRLLLEAVQALTEARPLTNWPNYHDNVTTALRERIASYR